MHNILWLDNDPIYLKPFLYQLEDSGHRVKVVTALTEAELSLRDRYDLLILDVMIPTKGEAEEDLYRPDETDYGHKTGLLFYRRNKGAAKSIRNQSSRSNG